MVLCSSIPTATRDEISANQWGAGPTFVALTQSNGYTVGLLANQIWGLGTPGTNGLGGGSIIGDDGSTILLPPGARSASTRPICNPSRPTPRRRQTTFTVSSESTYNWTFGDLDCADLAGVSQVLKIGSQPISIGVTGKYYAVRPEGAPAWGARFVLTFLFPK